MTRQTERFGMFGVGVWELVILGGICMFFIMAIVAVVVIVTMSNKKPKDD